MDKDKNRDVYDFELIMQKDQNKTIKYAQVKQKI